MSTRLWQIRYDALQYMHARTTAKLAGLDPDTLDDMFTEQMAEWMGVEVAPIEYTDDGIAIVSIIGPLYKRKSPFVSNYKAIGEALDELLEMEDDHPQACILKIDSPGGMVDGLDAICAKVAQLCDVMPVYASINGMGCSAAYRIAAQANAIYATEDSDVGSIGTYWQLLDMSAAYAKAGIRSVLLTTGPYKGIGVEGEPITDEQRAFLQDLTNKNNAMFLQDVATGRLFSEQQLTAVSDGRYYLANEALGLQLIDEIGSLDDVLNEIRSQREALNVPRKPMTRGTAQASTPEDETVETPVVETPETAGDEPAETPAEPESPQASTKGLAEYMSAFGDAEGARMFVAGKSWEQAQADTLQAVRGELQDARAELAQLKTRMGELAAAQAGEAAPLQLAGEARKKSFAEACKAAKK